MTSEVGQGTAAKLKATSSAGDAALVIGTTGEKFALRTCVEVAGREHRTELETQIAYLKKESDANKSAFGALVVDVHVCNSNGTFGREVCETCW